MQGEKTSFISALSSSLISTLKMGDKLYKVVRDLSSTIKLRRLEGKELAKTK